MSVRDGAGPVGGLDLAAVEARADAATPGPWWATPCESDDDDAAWLVGLARDDALDGYVAVVSTPGDASFMVEPTNRRADAEFIAAARSDVPALVAEVKRLRAHGIMIPFPEYEKACAERDAARAEAERLRRELECAQTALTEACDEADAETFARRWEPVS